MTDLKIKKISYAELREKPIEVNDDRYGIAAYFTESIRQTFLACPAIEDESECAVLLLMDGDIVIGRDICFMTRLKIGDEIVPVHTGCSQMVCEEYQKIGAGILLFTANTHEDKVNFGALYTPMRVKMLKKQKRVVFDIPQYTKITNTQPIFESSFKLRGFLLKLVSWGGNFLLKLLEIPNRLRLRKLLKKYNIRKETLVPEWAGEMATNDGHKYMEYHDTKWLQWNLDYNMNGFPEDIQSFYSIWDKSGNPMGFFMTKERLEEEAGQYKNLIRGTIVEWASADKDVLTEADLNLLAVSTFSSKVSRITTISDDPQTEKKFIKMGFRHRYDFQISFKDKIGLYTDAVDISNWRIRYGCSNAIIY